MRCLRAIVPFALILLNGTVGRGANLLRNDAIVTLAPFSPSKLSIFTGTASGCSSDTSVSLDAANPANCGSATPGEGASTALPGSDDADDLYIVGFVGGADPEGAVHPAPGRPLMVWQYENACQANGLRAVRSGAQVVLSTECNPPGACCQNNGTCSQLSQANCIAAGNTWVGGPCTSNPSPCIAACCAISTLGCQDSPLNLCSGGDDAWFPGEHCDLFVGACCIVTGNCREFVQQFCCERIVGGVWFAGSTCGQVGCLW